MENGSIVESREKLEDYVGKYSLQLAHKLRGTSERKIKTKVTKFSMHLYAIIFHSMHRQMPMLSAINYLTMFMTN